MHKDIVEAENQVIDSLRRDVDALVTNLQQTVTDVTTHILVKVYNMAKKEVGAAQTPNNPPSAQPGTPQQPTAPTPAPASAPKHGFKRKVSSALNNFFYGSHPNNPNFRNESLVGRITLHRYLEIRQQVNDLADYIIQEVQEPSSPPSPIATPIDQRPVARPEAAKKQTDPEEALSDIFQGFKEKLMSTVMKYLNQNGQSEEAPKPAAVPQQDVSSDILKKSRDWWNQKISDGSLEIEDKKRILGWFHDDNRYKQKPEYHRIRPKFRKDADKFMWENGLDSQDPADIRLIWPKHKNTSVIGPDID